MGSRSRQSRTLHDSQNPECTEKKFGANDASRTHQASMTPRSSTDRWEHREDEFRTPTVEPGSTSSRSSTARREISQVLASPVRKHNLDLPRHQTRLVLCAGPLFSRGVDWVSTWCRDLAVDVEAAPRMEHYFWLAPAGTCRCASIAEVDASHAILVIDFSAMQSPEDALQLKSAAMRRIIESHRCYDWLRVLVWICPGLWQTCEGHGMQSANAVLALCSILPKRERGEFSCFPASSLHAVAHAVRSGVLASTLHCSSLASARQTHTGPDEDDGMTALLDHTSWKS